MKQTVTLPDIDITPAEPVGAIIISVIATAIFAIVVFIVSKIRAHRVAIISAIRRFAQRLPQRTHPIMVATADSVMPTWRTNLGHRQVKSKMHVDRRIHALRDSRVPRINIIGAVYLDLLLRPIRISNLERGEFSDLDTVEWNCGGSARYVGFYLWSEFKQSSYLYSRVGENDGLSKELKKQLAKEEWIRSQKVDTTASSQSGVSIHLYQADHTFSTTFTHKGALAGFGWGSALKTIQRRTRHGGIVYISGYIRTNLCADLTRSLSSLSPKVLVCIDHGRFRSHENDQAIRALADAFKAGLIDVYICSYAEIRDYLTELDEWESKEHDDFASLQRVAESTKPLPRVTIVRGEASDQPPTAYILLDGTVDEVALTSSDVRPADLPGRKSAFNAGLLYALSRYECRNERDLHESLESVLHKAADRALHTWVGAR